MNKHKLTFILLCLFSAPLCALEVGTTLPPVEVTKRGELILKEHKISYTKWSSNTITQPEYNSAPTILYHVAARRESDTAIKPIMAAVRETLKDNSYRSITIVNISEAIWGTAGLVHAGMAGNKQENPDWKMIADEQGAVKKAWQLNDFGVAIILLDTHGKIHYVLNQQPDTQDREEIISVLNNLILENRPPQHQRSLTPLRLKLTDFD